MTIKDLRIGNYVGFKNRSDCYCEVVDLSYGGGIHIARIFEDGTEDDQPEVIEDITGIPITEEWLTRLGFTKKHEYIYDIFRNGRFVIQGGDNFFYKNISLIHIHQLQQLYFAIVGEELTLKNQ